MIETEFKKHVNLDMLTVRLHYSMYIVSIFEIFMSHTYLKSMTSTEGLTVRAGADVDLRLAVDSVVFGLSLILYI